MNKVLMIVILILTSWLGLFYTSHSNSSIDKTVQEAYESYKTAEKASSVAVRQEGFNRALTLYQEVEKRYKPTFGTGKLYYNIGNSYYQLGRYPWAVLYYYRAQALDPNNQQTLRNLDDAMKKLGLPSVPSQTMMESIFFFHHQFSLPHRLQLFSLFLIGTTLLGSLFVWYRRKWVKILLWINGLLCALFFLSVLYTYFLSPVEGILVNATVLYRDAGKEYALVTDQPYQAGSKVRILAILQNGKWLKIMTADGTIGFIPFESIQRI